MRPRLVLAWMVFLGLLPAAPAVAQEGLQSAVPSPSATKTGSRDQQLLDSLGPAPSRAGASSPSAARGQPAGSGETGNVREPRGAGSDVGPSSPLVRIEQRMRHVEQRLRQRQTGEETQGAQREIERQLDELISQLADSLPSATARQPDSVPRKDQPTSVTGDRPAREGVSQRDENGVSAPSAAAPARAAEEIWGHLPERLRRHMQSVEGIEFLPKYRQLIEDYYRRVAEDRTTSP